MRSPRSRPAGDTPTQLITVKIDKPDDTNFILGQTHFIKSVEDIHEALVGAGSRHQVRAGLLRGVRQVPGALVGHGSGHDRTGPEERRGHRSGPQLHRVPGRRLLPAQHPEQPEDGARRSAAFSARPPTPRKSCLPRPDQGRGILGVVDGFSPKGIEDEAEIKWRKDFLKRIGYKQ